MELVLCSNVAMKNGFVAGVRIVVEAYVSLVTLCLCWGMSLLLGITVSVVNLD